MVAFCQGNTVSIQTGGVGAQGKLLADRERSQISGRRVEKETGDKHIATEWTRSEDSREAYKRESRRIDANGGVKSDQNYNKIESPGKKYLSQDGG